MTERGRRKSLVGVVVSNKMEKTAVVAVERRVRHTLYRKIIRRTTRYKAHDATNSAVLGDVVRLEETRPLSKDKRWRIVQTLVRGNVAEVAPREIGAPEEEPVVAAQQASVAQAVAVEAVAVEPSAEPAGDEIASAVVEAETTTEETTPEAPAVEEAAVETSEEPAAEQAATTEAAAVEAVVEEEPASQEAAVAEAAPEPVVTDTNDEPATDADAAEEKGG